ncbi:MAG: Maf family protein [Synergistaceae bacterium]|nr:Maf family protein [Synergistaceae bacterium]
MKVILASASPRRKDLLSLIGCIFETYSPNVDETIMESETPESVCRRLSVLKAESASKLFAGDLIIAADTLVVIDNEIFGKPSGADEARLMLNMLSGREHKVITGLTIIYGDKITTETETTSVWFRYLSEDDIKSYISTGEYHGKAGAYAIQGYASLFIERIDGDYFNVVGLPLQRLSRMLEKIGIEYSEQLNLGDYLTKDGEEKNVHA